MTISPKLKSFLDKEKVKYEVLHHPEAYTAQEVAGAQHVPGSQMIKSVIIKVDGRFLMCVLPAIHRLDLNKAKSALHAKDLSLASEEDLAKLFPEYDLGAEPPFGSLYNLDVYADKTLESAPSVVFNAGTHTDTIKLKTMDFLKLVKPKFVEFGKHI